MDLKTIIKVVAFDCDGVLFDTVEANKAYYNQILNHFGLPDMTSRQFAYAHMHAVDETLAYLFGKESDLADVHAFRKQMNYLPVLAYMIIEPDLTALLRKLRPNYRIAIATNRTDTIDRVLKAFALQHHFDLVVCRADVPHPKPHPDILNRIIDHFQCQSQNLLYVGDSPVDESAAHAANTVFAAYKNPALKADLHISRLQELEGLLGI